MFVSRFIQGSYKILLFDQINFVKNSLIFSFHTKYPLLTSVRRNMSKQEIRTPNAPTPFGSYSQAIRVPVGQTIYLAGQIPYNEQEKRVILDSFEAQTLQTFANVKAVAEAAGGSLDDIVKLTIYITDFKYFPTVNEVMTKIFKKPYPARTTVGTKLGMNVDIEVDAIMVIPDKTQSKI